MKRFSKYGKNARFWEAWDQRKKELKSLELSCTCGRKHPEKTMHYAGCPYMVFWNREFLKFKDEFDRRETHEVSIR